jgi:hypothetical protein
VSGLTLGDFVRIVGAAGLTRRHPLQLAPKVTDDGSATISNDCAHNAFRVTVVIDCGGEAIARCGPEDLAAFGEVTLDVRDAVEKHMERVRENPWRPASSTNGIFIAGSKGRPVSTTFRAYVAWLTEQEVPRNNVAHDVVRHSMAHDGMRRTKPTPPNFSPPSGVEKPRAEI